jgi:(p)ppGpp synthase/HD superfamily hydrolase
MSSRLDQLAETPPDFIRDSRVLSEAFELARCAHSGQERKEPGSPYVVHPILVAERLHQHGYSEHVVAAALLHDVVERSDLTVDDVAQRFGAAVARFVDCLTDDPSLSDFVERKSAQREAVAGANHEVQAIFAADRTSNARELTRLIRAIGPAAIARDKVSPELRLRVWRDDLTMLDRRRPDLDLLPAMRDAIGGFAAAVAALRRSHSAAA